MARTTARRHPHRARRLERLLPARHLDPALDRPHAGPRLLQPALIVALVLLRRWRRRPRRPGRARWREIRVAVLDGVPAPGDRRRSARAARSRGPAALRQRAPTWLRLVFRGDGVEVRASRVPPCAGAPHHVGGGAVRVNARDYPGTIEVSATGDGLLVVNELPLEDYLAGTVKAEAGERTPLEMLKAQAIVARTYAAYHRRLNAARPFHILVDHGAPAVRAARWRPDSPVAGGGARDARPGAPVGRRPVSRPSTTRTAAATRRIRAWSSAPARCPRCGRSASSSPSDSPHRLWNLDLSLADLSAALRRGGVAVGRILALEVLERSVSLRVARIAGPRHAGSAVPPRQRVPAPGRLRHAQEHAVRGGGRRATVRGSPGAATVTAWASTRRRPGPWPSRATRASRSSPTTTRAPRSAPSAEPRPPPMSPDLGRVRARGHAGGRDRGRPGVPRGAAPGLQALDRLRRARRQALERADHATTTRRPTSWAAASSPS